MLRPLSCTGATFTCLHNSLWRGIIRLRSRGMRRRRRLCKVRDGMKQPSCLGKGVLDSGYHSVSLRCMYCLMNKLDETRDFDLHERVGASLNALGGEEKWEKCYFGSLRE